MYVSFYHVCVAVTVNYWRIEEVPLLFPISTSDGKAYLAQVTERAAARKIYDAAKKQGKTAGLVATKWVLS